MLLALSFVANASPYSGLPEAGRFFFYTDTTRYPVADRYGDPYTYPNRNPYYLQDTSFIKRNIEYDPVTKQYYIIEKIGSLYYRTPMTFSMQEFLDMKGREDEIDYFRKRASLLSNLNRRLYKPKFKFVDDWVNRIVGNGKIDIKPNGYVDLSAGYQGQKIDNPTLPERARKNGGFDFNMNSQFQVDANIGDKLKLPINYNTLANFNFENQLKLDYQGRDDEILKQLQMGTVNYSSKGTLIPGAQSLFGIKTQLQFGKLFVTTVLANQRSQRQSLGIQGGSSTQTFTFKSDEYEENRHFLMAQYFRSNYNNAMKNLPVVNSLAQILRVEVWVTNRTGATTETRDVVGLMDIGESSPFNTALWTGTAVPQPRNDANNEYTTIINTPGARNSTQVQSVLTGIGMQPIQDFEKTFARKLQPTDYYFNPQIGFISLNQQLQPDEVLGIAFQYSYNGKVYQVGEFSTDVPPDSSGTTQPVLFLKLLKATSQRTNLPIWDLMMKNVYSVGFGQLERSDFKLDLLYEEPSLGEKRYLPPADVSTAYKGIPLISLLNLDRLNNQNDPQPDGVFDFIEGYTVLSSQSRIIFPVLEPFGHDLDYVYDNQAMRDKYLYYPLYDTIKAIAQTFANLNRFKFSGRSKSGLGTSEYQLGFNIPKNSVTVTAGGQVLRENIDYEINYDLGSLKIINQAIINSGVPVNVQYENNATFGLQTKNYLALRLDYLASRKLTLGGTIVRLSERPFFVKQNYGDDPIRNTMYGLDFDYRNEVPRLSRWLDKLPFYSTKAMSNITAYGEAAWLKPGHAPQIGKGNEGVIYVDDFEGTRSSIDLRFPLISWTLASAPQKAVDKNNNILFPEAELHNNLEYGYNRAKLAWYNIEQVLQETRNTNNPLRNNLSELSKPETRQVYQREIFPQRTLDFGQGILTTFDLAYYPKERGPYNFEYRNGRIDGNGYLLNPKQAWGGIMRNIDQTDFETGNIEFIEFWMQDPFIRKPSSNGGELYFDLGNISEDVLKDGKRQYENGLPTLKNPNIPVDNSSVWGRTPSNPIQVTNAFSNDPEDRPYQDVGYDGLTDSLEKSKFAPYINNLATNFGAGSSVYQNANIDPSNDNFRNYRDDFYDQAQAGILQRYKDVNNPHGNSPIANNNSEFTSAFTLYPDQEELNRDNTLNESEEYFQYRVDLQPNMTSGTNFITDVRDVDVDLADGTTRTEKWYLFRIPVTQYQNKVGNIPDFKSIRFIRMFMTGFDDTVVCRFGKLELIRNQWRRFNYQVDSTGFYTQLPANDPTKVDVLAVNLEENDQRQPIRYVIPPGIDRQQQLSNNNVQLLLNEQSLSVKVLDLPRDKARGVFKTMNVDLRQYGRLSMFIHAEEIFQNSMNDGDLNAVVRIGNDFVSNYYEIKIPLKLTSWGSTDSLTIWPVENNLDFDLQILTALKSRRNKGGFSPSQYYSEQIGNKRFAIIGNPNLGEVRGMLLGVENANIDLASAEIWYNELRLSKLDEKGGWAAVGRIDLTLADLGAISISGTARSKGFGTLEQRVNERSREDFYQFDVSTNIDAGKLLPKKANIQIPVYAGINKTSSSPEYDPYDLDVKLKDKLRVANSNAKDSIKKDALDVTTIKTITLTNVKKNRTGNKKPQPWDISNLDLNYSYTKTQKHNPLIESDEVRRTRGAVGYNFALQPKFVEPFKTLVKSKSKWLSFVKDFNFNYKPSQITVKADVFRQFGAVRPKNVGAGPYKIPETYDKYFTFDRFYIVRWDLTRSINLDFSAVNNARIDEPFGRIDTKEKKDSVRNNFFKGGRNTRYHQEATFTYNFPTNKFPLIDWTSIRASYKAEYDWIGASLLAKSLGNTITNGQTKNINGELNFDQLYNKSKFLRAVNTPSASSGAAGKKNQNQVNPQNNNQDVNKNTRIDLSKIDTTTRKGKKLYRKLLARQKKTDRNANKQKGTKNPNDAPEVGGVVKAFVKLATSVKNVSVQYTETAGTSLPGYLDSTKILGQNWKSMAPGYNFILGYQPDTNWINQRGIKGLLSHDPIFNTMIQQRYDQRLSLKAQVSPVRDLNIDLNLDKTFNKNYSELFKDTTSNGTGALTRLNAYAMGSFNISYISYQTLFTKFDPNVLSETFKQFEANRILLSGKLGNLNPYLGPNPTPGADGYYKGYGRYAQDVLIPSFIGAYTNKDPLSVKLTKNSNPGLRSNPFSGLQAKPNWNITYNGLSRIPGLDKIFTNVTIRHGYRSNLSMNSYNTALFFQDPLRYGFPSFADTLTGNYIPYFLVPNITISEEFSPLFSIDATFTNQLSARIEYRKTRQLSLSLIDYQLAENRSTEFTIGADWRVRGMPLIRKIGKMKLDNDVTFKLDLSIRDDATANSKLDQKTAFGTAGQKVIRINPTIDYVVNSRVRATLYFEQTRNIPKIATTAPITNTRAGLQLRISLAQ
ncbi:MAG: cell surface protein SprA [Chitinophagaceae bacterium]|nr:MAG: cell surface protein SprA [Chitinophagaceae bacterium]